MPFVAENGTGLANANSLSSVADADAYFTDRGITAWTGTEAVKQTALIKATDYMETRWNNRWLGLRQFPDTPQALSFPRLYINNDGAVPVGIKRACAEYALRALTAALAPDSPVDASGRLLDSVKTKVGPIETEKTYRSGAPATAFRAYPAADALVRPFLNPGGLVR